jgi:hypothetical protein
MTLPSLSPDEFWGQGGSYLLDPKTGIRTLIERTEPAQPSDSTPEELSNGTPEPQASDPGQD